MPRTYRDYPMVGVGAVVWRGERVLLVRRGTPPREGEWSLPGGAQRIGETVAEAAHREIREETGVTIRITGLVDVIDAIFPDETGRIAHHYTLIDLLAEWVSGEAAPAGDAAEVAWVPLGGLNSYALWEETVRVIRKSASLRTGRTT